MVAWFQAQAVLTDTPGVVEAATAKRLNIELRERCAFPVGYQHGIVGQVSAFLLTPASVPIPLAV